MLGPLLKVQMWFSVAGARVYAPCQNWAKKSEDFAAVSATTNTLHDTTLHYNYNYYNSTATTTTTLQLQQLQLQLHYNYNYNYSYNFATFQDTTLDLHYTTLSYITWHYTHYTTTHATATAHYTSYTTPH